MNIGIFTNAYHPITSGVVKVIDFMQEGLSSLGHTVYIIAPSYRGYADENSHVFRYPSVRVLPNVDFPLPITYAPHLTAAVRKLPLDIVHAQHPFLLGLLGARLATQKKIPLVFTFHTRYEDYAHYASFGIPSKTAKKVVQKLVSSFVNKCSAVVAPSASIQALAPDYGANGRWHHIPNAIDLRPFRKGSGTKIRERHSLHGKKVAIFVGRLAMEKNLLFLIQAFAKTRDKASDSVLLLVGDGPFRQILEEEAARLGLQSSVIFTGLAPYEEIPHYLAASHLFVTASTSEVNPLSILEAMAAGIPILTLRAPWVDGVVAHNATGWLTEENLPAFSEALALLLASPEKLKKLGTAAESKAEGHGYMQMARQLDKLYQSLSKVPARV